MERRDENELERDLGKEPTGADEVDTGDVDADDQEGDDNAEEGSVEGVDELQGADDAGTARERA
jgi:hypothetical protein